MQREDARENEWLPGGQVLVELVVVESDGALGAEVELLEGGQVAWRMMEIWSLVVAAIGR